jgi:hypothetical protein
MSYREHQRLAGTQAATDAIRSHNGATCPTG